jgi:hypothetical protein
MHMEARASDSVRPGFKTHLSHFFALCGFNKLLKFQHNMLPHLKKKGQSFPNWRSERMKCDDRCKAPKTPNSSSLPPLPIHALIFTPPYLCTDELVKIAFHHFLSRKTSLVFHDPAQK